MHQAATPSQSFGTGHKLKGQRGSDISKMAQGDGSECGKANAPEFCALRRGTPIIHLPGDGAFS